MMKFNWGTGIVITIIAFIAFIMYFVITMSTNNAYNHDLVTDKYYQAELNYQQEINAHQNASKAENKVTLKKTNKGIEIKFPINYVPEDISGKVFLYRPSNKQLDFEMPISISNPYLLVPEQRLLDGRWNIKIHWKYKNKDFLLKKEIVY